MSDHFAARARIRLAGLLPRLRIAHPLPLDAKEVYAAAFPESKLAVWCGDPVSTDMRNKALPYRNLVRCTHRESVVHFCLNSQDELDAFTDDSDRALFWVQFPRQVVAPPLGGAFQLTESMRCNKALVSWFTDARFLDDEINHFTHKIYKAVANMRNSSELALAWPEVAKAAPGVVDALATKRAAARSPRIPVLRKEVLAYFPPTEMARVTDMLATAIMLPSMTMPSSWVDMYSPEIGDGE